MKMNKMNFWGSFFKNDIKEENSVNIYSVESSEKGDKWYDSLSSSDSSERSDFKEGDALLDDPRVIRATEEISISMLSLKISKIKTPLWKNQNSKNLVDIFRFLLHPSLVL